MLQLLLSANADPDDPPPAEIGGWKKKGQKLTARHLPTQMQALYVHCALFAASAPQCRPRVGIAARFAQPLDLYTSRDAAHQMMLTRLAKKANEKVKNHPS